MKPPPSMNPSVFFLGGGDPDQFLADKCTRDSRSFGGGGGSRPVFCR